MSDTRLAQHPALDEPGAGPPDFVWRELEGAPSVNAVSDGVLQVEVSSRDAAALSVRIARDHGERCWGFGIRSDEVERVAGMVECWVGEGPYQHDEYPLVHAITPRWAVRQRLDATYYPIPWLLSSAGYGVLVDNPEMSWFHLGVDWSVEVLADRLSLHLFNGSTVAEVLCRFTAQTGRQPFPSAPWFLGPWVQTGHADLVDYEKEVTIIQTLRAADAPVSAIETHMRRLPAGAHETRREAERKRTALFHEYGLTCLTYLNPFLSVDYAERFEQAAQLLQRRTDGRPYLYPAYIGGREPPVTTEGQLDFTCPGAEELFVELAREALEDGHDGWMEDFGEYTPPDAIAADGKTGDRMHNLYPVQFHAAGRRAAEIAGGGKPVARMVRSGWTGSAPHAPLVWGGDPTTGWGFDGLASALVQGLSAGLSGIAFWGSDIGGFFTLGDQELDGELLIRWIQLGALSPLMRTKAEGVAIPPRARPQIWDPDILPHWRRWAKLHVQLSPYLLRAASEYVETGMPLMRHMCLIDRDSRRSDQYMLGPDLLVAPVLEPGLLHREVELPRGRWLDLWRSAQYDDVSGRIVLDTPRIVEGPATVVLPAPLDEVPILVRQPLSPDAPPRFHFLFAA